MDTRKKDGIPKGALFETGPDPKEAVKEWVKEIGRRWDRKLLSVNRYDRFGKGGISIDTRPNSPGSEGENGIPPCYIGTRKKEDKLLFCLAWEDGKKKRLVFFGNGIDNAYLFSWDGWTEEISLDRFLRIGEGVVADFCRASDKALREKLRTWTRHFSGEDEACFTNANTYTIEWEPEHFSILVEGRKGVRKKLVWNKDGFFFEDTPEDTRILRKKKVTFKKFCRKLVKLMDRADAEFDEWSDFCQAEAEFENQTDW